MFLSKHVLINFISWFFLKNVYNTFRYRGIFFESVRCFQEGSYNFLGSWNLI